MTGPCTLSPGLARSKTGLYSFASEGPAIAGALSLGYREPRADESGQLLSLRFACAGGTRLGGARRRSTARHVLLPGCQAVAQAIVDNGLADYYRHRDALPDSPREALPGVFSGPRTLRSRRFSAEFRSRSGRRRARSVADYRGITCAACIWLNERHVAQLPGVTGVHQFRDASRARSLGRAAHHTLGDPGGDIRHRLSRASL